MNIRWSIRNTDIMPPEISVVLSPFNEKEDNSSEPKLHLSMCPSMYSDMAFVSIMEPDNSGNVILDFQFKVTDKGVLEVAVVSSSGEVEEKIYSNSIDNIHNGILL